MGRTRAVTKDKRTKKTIVKSSTAASSTAKRNNQPKYMACIVHVWSCFDAKIKRIWRLDETLMGASARCSDRRRAGRLTSAVHGGAKDLFEYLGINRRVMSGRRQARRSRAGPTWWASLIARNSHKIEKP